MSSPLYDDHRTFAIVRRASYNGFPEASMKDTARNERRDAASVARYILALASR
jgi:hypothetical protein